MKDNPLQEFLSLPDEVIDWYQRQAFLAAYELGQPYDFDSHWRSLSPEMQRKTVAMLINEAFPNMPCPRFSVKKRAGALKTPQLLNAPVPETAIADATETVKKILMNASKIRFIGAEGCGKTSKARWLCRERIALGHKVYWINPHLNADDNQKLRAAGVTIVGGGRDYEAIADFCLDMVDGDSCQLSRNYAKYSSVVGAKFSPVTFVLDELTNYKDEVGEPIEKFIKASMQEFSKISWHTIYITHNDTLACMGAPNGTANLIKSSVFDLRLETDILKGNRIPKAIAKYRMPNTDFWHDVTIPVDWQ